MKRKSLLENMISGGICSLPTTNIYILDYTSNGNNSFELEVRLGGEKPFTISGNRKNCPNVWTYLEVLDLGELDKEELKLIEKDICNYIENSNGYMKYFLKFYENKILKEIDEVLELL